MSLAKGHFFVVNGLPPLESAKFVFTSGFSGGSAGYQNGVFGTLVVDSTPWAFTRLTVNLSYGDMIFVSSLLAADVVANGTGGRNLRITGDFLDATIPLSDFSLAGDTFTKLSGSVYLDPGPTYNAWIE